MKSQFLLLVVTSLYLLSCKKESSDPFTEKKIIQTNLCTEKPLISKSDKVFVGLRYYKNYTEKDKVTLTLNGIPAFEKGYRVNEFEGTNYYFEFPSMMNSGEVELILTIQNDQNTYIQKKKVRIIENYDLETAWNNLDRTYILASFPFMYYFDINFETISNLIVNGKPAYDEFDTSIEIGNYLPDGKLLNTIAYKSFLSGLNGRYTLIYNDQGALTQIKILQGNPNIDPQITYEKIVNDVSQVYGPSISVEYDKTGNKITKFQNAKFNLWVYYPMDQNIYTIVTLR